jgi:hypothetical protein
MQVRDQLKDRSQTVASLQQSQDCPVHLDILVNELAEIIEPVLVAPAQVAPVEVLLIGARRANGYASCQRTRATAVERHVRSSPQTSTQV